MIDMLVDKSRTVDGQPTSLKDLGYDMIGIDEGWEVCDIPVSPFRHWQQSVVRQRWQPPRA